MKPVVIVGAGVAGLTAARMLEAQKIPYVLIDRDPVLGGKAGSFQFEDHWFDYAGHFLHSLDSLPKEVQGWLDFSEWTTYNKAGWYESVGRLIRPGMVQNDFPFDGHPDDVEDLDYTSLDTWMETRFGSSACDAFLRKYNEKMFGCALSRMAVTELAAARSPTPAEKQYNSVFAYPKDGGIKTLAEMLKGPDIQITPGNVTVIQVGHLNRDVPAGVLPSWQPQMVRLEGGDVIETSAIIATVPIRKYRPELFSMEAPTLTIANGFGIPDPERLPTMEWSWLYTAREDNPWFRIGNYQCCGGEKRDDGRIPFFAESSSDLGWVTLMEYLGEFFTEHEVVQTLTVPFAYPVYPAGGTEELDKDAAIDFEAASGVYWCGRYGLDQWYSMVQSIQSATECTTSAINFLQKKDCR